MSDPNRDFGDECQIQSVGTMGPPLKATNILWQIRKMVMHRIRRKSSYWANLLAEALRLPSEEPPVALPEPASAPLQPGDIVRIRSRQEIEATLRNNALKGCAMMHGMWQYCGTCQRVFKRVEKFIDERDYLIKKAKGIVLLEGIHCAGTKSFGPCDRSCFFFWREEWLEKVE